MFNNQPLVCRAVNVALSSMLIDEVIVSSDSGQILNVAIDYFNSQLSKPLIPILRPPELATDNASVIDVLRHAISEYMDEIMIVMLYPTYPLRTVQLVDDVIARLETFGAGAMITIVQADKKVFWYVKQDEDGFITKLIPNNYYRIQDMPLVFRHAGAVHCIYKSELPNVDNNGMSANTRGFIVENKHLCLEVDDLKSFKLAENIFEETRIDKGKQNVFFDFID